MSYNSKFQMSVFLTDTPFHPAGQNGAGYHTCCPSPV